MNRHSSPITRHSSFDLKAFLAEYRQRVDAALERFFPASDGLEKTVVEAARYSLFAGGKRLRPILCLTAAEVVGGSGNEALTAACALEMVHTYSLIHDDLPAMDDDDLRRGRPTNHKVYGEAVAILAGDLLLTEAFGVLADDALEPNAAVPPERRLRALAILARASGGRGMIAGQVIDLESETREVDLATVEYMHIHKTGALISASLEMGAVLGGGTDGQIQDLVRYGRHLGLAFQITDDLLDIEGDPQVMGKPAGSDQAKNKKTYPALLGLARSREMAQNHVERAVEALGAFGGKADPLRAIARYLLERKA
ncbi:farnesyl-diphosphate synthase [Desulfacinum infernum DSM 9756]|uniref:Farnesyl-diphosphate synthase n=1 Tax=Desulfacinum infernum DSM 9756 TaxID=1121391 RepID=A0A1M5CR10_9BACT|nr:farnesyl diphosphate synthase [Desulfacinum infernum]SHF57194.1 farnesyl-diphosphate synthase [Desulfacinum infernum DSM 9756]